MHLCIPLAERMNPFPTGENGSPHPVGTPVPGCPFTVGRGLAPALLCTQHSAFCIRDVPPVPTVFSVLHKNLCLLF